MYNLFIKNVNIAKDFYKIGIYYRIMCTSIFNVRDRHYKDPFNIKKEKKEKRWLMKYYNHSYKNNYILKNILFIKYNLIFHIEELIFLMKIKSYETNILLAKC